MLYTNDLATILSLFFLHKKFLQALFVHTFYNCDCLHFQTWAVYKLLSGLTWNQVLLIHYVNHLTFVQCKIFHFFYSCQLQLNLILFQLLLLEDLVDQFQFWGLTLKCQCFIFDKCWSEGQFTHEQVTTNMAGPP